MNISLMHGITLKGIWISLGALDDTNITSEFQKIVISNDGYLSLLIIKDMLFTGNGINASPA
ncbi:4629_t:CDS:2 [Acaulospora colombiana]|uniref:4629_t:CDS:1 n=1 Tax=Acaulospora colombiana TaxID=27376 RepID=A0ACA9KMR4_9GLOM|nr:4629_t:CDS:2 [Acaulospora colombiana]